MLENVYEGLNAQKCIWRLKCSKINMKAWMLKNVMKAEMLENVYEGLNFKISTKFQNFNQN